MILSFWFIFTLILYCYFFYPCILYVIARYQKLPLEKRGDFEPSVSIVLSVWNEEDVIRQKIENLLSLDYPHEKIEIIIGSDGSTDRTDAIIEEFHEKRVSLVKNTSRRGKMVTINELIKRAKSEIIVFTDARQKFDANVIKRLIGNFTDAKVGCVSGELMFSKKDDATAKGINLYWSYEKFIRRVESDIHSMLGATGAIYAIRKELYVPIPNNVILDDMFVPLKIIQKGYRAIFDSSAKAYDEVADNPREEHRRKARTLFGNYQIFWIFRSMFIPFKSPIAIQLFSHKFLRVIVPFLMIALFVINWFLIKGEVYRFIFILQVSFYVMAIIGGLARNQNYGILKIISKICYVPYVFCLLNLSALAGFLRFARARQGVVWDKARDKK